MSSSDFKFVLAIAIILVLWGAFVLAFTSGQIEDSNKLSEQKQDTGIIASLSLATDWLNPFSEGFNSEYAIINIFIFSILIFGSVVVAARFLRGV